MFKIIKNIFLFLFVFGFLIAIFVEPDNSDHGDTDWEYESEKCPEGQASDAEIRLTARSWVDYGSNDYCVKYTSDIDDYEYVKEKRKNYIDNSSISSQEFWGTLYSNLFIENQDKIESLVDSLWNIKEIENLNHFDFANTVVSFVQDIPYSYILDRGNCVDQEGNYFDCLEDEEYGILSPLEFIHTLRGDCDTRTVLLYTIFKQFNYSPKIANSDAYAHSVLLMDVATSGDYLMDQGLKYYFWETTATGWQAGILPPDCNDVNEWEIVLH